MSGGDFSRPCRGSDLAFRMDGISIAASIDGLLGAAAKAGMGLNDFMIRVKEALLEARDISACLRQVQSLH